MLRSVSVLVVLAFGGVALAGTIRVPQDMSTIQQAVSVASTGDEVLISAGVYNENVVVNATNDFTLRGKGNVRIIGSGSDATLEVSECNNVSVSGLKISGTGDTLFTIEDSVDLDVSKCSILAGASQLGLVASEGRAVNIRSCEVRGGIVGIQVSTSTSQVVDCDVIDTAGFAINAWGAAVVVRDCRVRGAGGDAIVIGSFLGPSRRIVITGNEIKNCENDGISSSFDSAESVVRDNKITKCAGNGIKFGADIHRMSISGNSIRNVGEAGIWVTGDKSSVEGNEVKKCGAFGFLVFSGASENFVAHNRCTKAVDYAFKISGNSTSVVGNIAVASAAGPVVDTGSLNEFLGNNFEP